MALAIFWSIAWFLIFMLIGWPFIQLLGRKSRHLALPFAEILALVLVLYLFAIFLKFGWNLLLAMSVVFVISAIQWVRYLWRLNLREFLRGIQGGEALVAFAVFLVPATIYSLLAGSGVDSPRLAWRTGPDTFGWLASANFVCRGDSLVSLEKRVERAMGQTLEEYVSGSSDSSSAILLGQIPSATDQVAAEFLLVSDRLGIPGILGFACATLPSGTFAPAVGLASWAVGLAAVTVWLFTKRFEIGKMLRLVISLIASLNFSVLSVGLEGGLGQLISLPIFLFSVVALVSGDVSIRVKCASLLLMLYFALTSYFDLLFLGGFVVAFVAVACLWFKRDDWKVALQPRGALHRSLALALVPSLLFAETMWDQVALRFGSGGEGGWSQGTLPLFSNVFGLSNWLPTNYPAFNLRGLPEAVFDIALSVLVIGLFFIIRRTGRILLISIILNFLILFAFVYLQSPLFSEEFWHSNNYILWKLSLYVSPVFFLCLIFLWSRSLNWNKFSRGFGSRLHRAVAWGLLVIGFVSAAQWTSGWLTHRQLSSDPNSNAIAVDLASRYDLKLEHDPWFVWTLLPDLRWAAENRGSGTVMRSEDGRQLLVVDTSNILD